IGPSFLPTVHGALFGEDGRYIRPGKSPRGTHPPPGAGSLPSRSGHQPVRAHRGSSPSIQAIRSSSTEAIPRAYRSAVATTLTKRPCAEGSRLYEGSSTRGPPRTPAGEPTQAVIAYDHERYVGDAD